MNNIFYSKYQLSYVNKTLLFSLRLVRHGQRENRQGGFLTPSCGVSHYTRIDGIFGKGGTSGTHLGTDIWPGRNNVLLLAVSDDEAKKMLAGIQALRKTLGLRGSRRLSGILKR